MDFKLERVFDINKLCRLCLCEKDTILKATENLLYKIKKLSDIEFTSEAPVCELCEIEVDKCYNFCTKIINNYMELKKAIEGRKVKEEISDFEPHIDLNAVKTEEVIVKEEIEEYSGEMNINANEHVGNSKNSNVMIESSDDSIAQNENCINSNAQIVNNINSNVQIVNSVNSNVQAPIYGFLIFKPNANVILQAQKQSSSNLTIAKAPPPTQPLKCKFCPETFIKQDSLDIHLINHEGLKYSCECGAKFGLESRLKYHISKEHSSKKLISCTECNQKFQTKKQLRSHQRVHLPEKPKEIHRCDVCNKEFKMKCFLRYHNMRHTNERRFKCDICGDKFNFKSGLTSHKQIHLNERKHLCSYCGMSFNHSQVLKKHIRVHTGE